MSSSTSTSYDLPITSAGDKSNVAITKRYTKRAQALDCFKLILFLTLIIILLGLVPGVTRFLIFLQPNPLEFKIQSFSLSVLNVSQDSITADFDVTVLVLNTNKKNIFFDEIEGFLALSDTRISNLSIASIEASKISQKTFNGEFRNVVMNVANCSFCGEVNLTVEFEVEGKYGGFTWPTRKDNITVLCDYLRVSTNKTTSTRMNLGSRECVANGRWKRLVTKCYTIFWTYIYVTTVFVGILLLSL